MDTVEHNRLAWNEQSRWGSPWCDPVTSQEIDQARVGDWAVILTPNRKVPRQWFGRLKGKKVLCLASGGGQQAPVLAAAGAIVTSFDNSDEQLEKDSKVAHRDGLDIEIERGDMADLSRFANETFDIIFHPVSNLFVENLEPVWREAARVLKSNGRLMAGFCNPMHFLFDHDEALQTEQLIVKHKLPYSDLNQFDQSERDEKLRKGEALEFSHSLDSQIGGQLNAGMVLTGLYEDNWNDESTLLNRFSTMFIATLTRKTSFEALANLEPAGIT